MVGVQVCRLCLVMDVKLHDLQSYPLESYFNSIIGTGNSLSSRNLSPYACYECAALVKKFYFFKQKCLRSQAVLYGIANEFGELSPTDIKVIDRQSLHIASPLELVILPEVNLIDYHYSNQKIKSETVPDGVESYKTESCIREKEKDNAYLIIISDSDVSSDDDELLSQHKGRNEKKEVKIEYVEEVLGGLEVHQEDQKKENKEIKIEYVEELLEGLEFAQATNDILEQPEISKKKTGRTKKLVIPKKTFMNSMKTDKKDTKIEDVEEVLEGLEAQHKDKKKEREETKIEDVEEALEGIDPHHKDQKNEDKETYIEDVEEGLESLEFAQTTDEILEQPEISKQRTGRSKKSGASPKKAVKNSSVLNEEISDIQQYVTVISLTIEEQIEEINKRKESTNYLNSPYKCELCFKGFVDIDAWKLHISKHSPTAGDLECRICKIRFKRRTALQRHSLHHVKRYVCKTCPYISTSTTQAKRHEGKHRGVTFVCESCGEIFTVWSSYMSHLRIKHPSDSICGICGYSFINKTGLAMHKNLKHKDILEKADENKEEGPYCKECDVKFLSTEAFKRHMVMSVKHTNNSDFSKGCRTCGEKFKTLEELRLHQRKEHSRTWPKHYSKKSAKTTWPIKCEQCPQEITNAREYWAHFRRWHPDKKYPVTKNYVCDICGRGFSINAFLVYHRRRHFDERNYKCTQCDKSFFTTTNLLVHEKTHTDSRPFPCSVCSKAFKCKGALVKHLKSHTGEKPYECEICGKFFTTSTGMRLHVRTVHQKLPAPPRKRRERCKAGQKEPPK